MEKQNDIKPLYIGVTGHMDLKKPNYILKRITDFFSIIKNDYPDRKVVMLSCLAEGADLLFVKGGFSVFPTAELTVILPFDLNEYKNNFKAELKDFEYYYSKANDVKNMSDIHKQKTKEDGYEYAGKYIVSKSDILLAVWDGKILKSGIAQGGTCDIVTKIIKENKLSVPILVHLVAERDKEYTSKYISINEKIGDLTTIKYKNGKIISINRLEKV